MAVVGPTIGLVPFKEAVTADILTTLARMAGREEVLIERTKENKKNQKDVRPFVKKLQILQTQMQATGRVGQLCFLI